MADRRPKRRCVTTKNLVPSAVHYVGYVEDDETPEAIMRKFEELERIQQALAEKKQQKQQRAESVEPEDRAGTVRSSASPEDSVQAGSSPEAAGDDDAGPCDADEALDDEALLEVFKHTSVFNVRSAMQNNELFLEDDKRPGARRDPNDDVFVSDSEAEVEEMNYLRGFWSDDDFDMSRTAAAQRWRSAPGGRQPKEPKEPKPPKEPKEPRVRGPGKGALPICFVYA